MNITQYTPNGNWPTDDILVQETVKALDSTKDQSDFVYTITVEGHGDYPTEKILTDPAIKVSGAATEESKIPSLLCSVIIFLPWDFLILI